MARPDDERQPSELAQSRLDRRSRRPTAADVARHAGLSRATVSYVLNNTPHQVIPQQTKERVHAAATELGYVPSAAARALSSGRSDVVLLLLPDWPIGPSIGSLLEHLSTALASHGYTFVAHPQSAGRAVSEVWKALTPAAVITFEELDEVEATRLRASGVELAIALFGGHRGGQAMDIPEQQTGRLQAEHLAANGHQRLGYAWPDDPRVFAFAQPRLEGVRQACADLELPEPVVRPVALGLAGARSALEHWRGADPVVTGICAYNDDIALTVLAQSRQQGLQVPAELAVVGVDDIAAAAVAVPGLTTVEIDNLTIARYIAGTIASRLAGAPLPSRPLSDSRALIVRESA